jgi:hypothetical protein
MQPTTVIGKMLGEPNDYSSGIRGWISTQGGIIRRRESNEGYVM